MLLRIRGAISAIGLGLVGMTSCASRYEVRVPPRAGYDAAIVLGCPNEEDGRLSRCQASRAAWAAELWRRGVARAFITSGAAVHTPFVEAETLAQAMTALGVPADRIWLETDALHTDENVFNSMRIARALGMGTLAVVSNGGHAAWACKMMSDWGHECAALPVDLDAVKAQRAGIETVLASQRYARVPDGEWLPLPERESRRAAALGIRRRPPSYVVYAQMALGQPWQPPMLPSVPRVTWAERSAMRPSAPLAAGAQRP
jgi:uncharacterized SAM-binding protein YcdF (DUF218 family)